MKRLIFLLLTLLSFPAFSHALTSESTIKPTALWVRRIEGRVLYVRFRWDIQSVTKRDMDGASYSMWEYKEQEVIVKVPATFAHPKNTRGIPLWLTSSRFRGELVTYLKQQKSRYMNFAKETAKVDLFNGKRSRYWTDGKVQLLKNGR